MSGNSVVYLFSYGTLQLPQVQQATFGRLLEGHADALVGFERRMLCITDPYVLATSGATEHPVVMPSADSTSQVEGMVFAVTADEIAQADRYEVEDYVRVETALASGRRAFVYVARV